MIDRFAILGGIIAGLVAALAVNLLFRSRRVR